MLEHRLGAAHAEGRRLRLMESMNDTEVAGVEGNFVVVKLAATKLDEEFFRCSLCG